MGTKISVIAGMGLAVILAGSAVAKPYIPDDDAIILERLPEKGDPALAQLKRLRALLGTNPQNIDVAARVARQSIEAARATGDPRFLGQAQAALGPWWTTPEPPAGILILRATLKQSQHDFTGALVDLDRLLAARPADGQALITRATVLTVQGRYADAQRDCARLAPIAPEIVTTACLAAPASLSGQAEDAYRGLTQSLSRSANGDPGLRGWAETLAAELATRLGDAAAADRHFRAALAADPRDAYLLGAYADFLLEERRARDVLPLLRDETKNDALLLRLALAEMVVPEMAAQFDAHRSELGARFDAAHRRGDSLHRREEARFRLLVAGDSREALKLALENWNVQREPADLMILVEAANANRDVAALAIARDWIAANRLEDRAIGKRMGSGA